MIRATFSGFSVAGAQVANVWRQSYTRRWATPEERSAGTHSRCTPAAGAWTGRTKRTLLLGQLAARMVSADGEVAHAAQPVRGLLDREQLRCLPSLDGCIINRAYRQSPAFVIGSTSPVATLEGILNRRPIERLGSAAAGRLPAEWPCARKGTLAVAS